MRTLITGAAGFIGSHLAERCVEKGHAVRAFVRYNSRNAWGWLERSPLVKEMEVVTGDVRDFDSVRDAMRGCDSVFHLAALIGIPYSYVSPLAYVKTNVEGTYNVLQAARELSVSGVVVTSTSETYGAAQYVPIDEKHPLVGQSPYSASKIGADQLAVSYWRSFGLPVKIVRPFNTYGPRQSARAVIPSAIVQILSGADEIKLGNIEPTRDLTYVSDTVKGMLAVAECRGQEGEVINVGSNAEISVGDLVSLIARLIGAEISVTRDPRRVRPAPSEVDRLRCDNSRLLQNTDWEPDYTLERGLAETIEWFRRHLSEYKSDIYGV